MIRKGSNVCPTFIKYLSGLYITILIFVQNIHCGYWILTETAKEYPQYKL